MTSQQVIDWIYDRTRDDDFESKDKLKRAISDDDTKGRITKWIDNDGYGSSLYQSEIQSKIDEFEREPLEPEVLPDVEEQRERERQQQADTLLGRISQANTLAQIDRIDIDLPDSPERTQVVSEWNEKRFQIQERIEEETGVFPGG